MGTTEDAIPTATPAMTRPATSMATFYNMDGEKLGGWFRGEEDLPGTRTGGYNR